MKSAAVTFAVLMGSVIPMVLAAQTQVSATLSEQDEAQVVEEGLGFTEGPTADSSGNLYFTDIANNRVHKLDLQGNLTVAREDSNGANGLAFDADGRLLACEGGAKRLTAMAPDGSLEVLAEEYDGEPLNSPNDLWIDQRGGIYFTDPNYSEPENLTQHGEHVYYLPPGGGELERVADDMGKPNGVIGTPDGTQLYVADTELAKVFVFNVEGDGGLGDREVFVEDAGSDGMTRDARGNLYITWGSGVNIYNPDGEQIGFIETHVMPTNVGFAGEDHRTLYITARDKVYAMQMAVRGQRLGASE